MTTKNNYHFSVPPDSSKIIFVFFLGHFREIPTSRF